MNGTKCQKPLQTIIEHHLRVINSEFNKTAHQVKAINSNISSLFIRPNLYQLDKKILLLGKLNTVRSKSTSNSTIAVAQFGRPTTSTGGN